MPSRFQRGRIRNTAQQATAQVLELSTRGRSSSSRRIQPELGGRRNGMGVPARQSSTQGASKGTQEPPRGSKWVLGELIFVTVESPGMAPSGPERQGARQRVRENGSVGNILGGKDRRGPRDPPEGPRPDARSVNNKIRNNSNGDHRNCDTDNNSKSNNGKHASAALVESNRYTSNDSRKY